MQPLQAQGCPALSTEPPSAPGSSTLLWGPQLSTRLHRAWASEQAAVSSSHIPRARSGHQESSKPPPVWDSRALLSYDASDGLTQCSHYESWGISMGGAVYGLISGFTPACPSGVCLLTCKWPLFGLPHQGILCTRGESHEQALEMSVSIIPLGAGGA